MFKLSRNTVFFLLPVALLLSACSSDGDLSNIFWRKLTWASYISGEDVKGRCAAEGLPEYRIVYNANRAESVLIFNWGGNDRGENELEYDRLNRAFEGHTISLENASNFVNPEFSMLKLSSVDKDALAHSVLSDINVGGLEAGAKVISAEHFVVFAACVDNEFSLSVFNQSDLNENYPVSLMKLLSLAEMDKKDQPILPTGEMSYDSYILDKLSGEETFNHYDLNFDGESISIGRNYWDRT